ncbi:hypothetical protein H8S23_01775 [Anaerofilum sp. BX8]|uniref:Uncharacterized protein n=1 Tax=Anaerofilum hominis TaxID=2763016 RepID=A0A923I8J5_9FIRM|nr:hypothetical protein [Anaerofilum hominis]MBC5580228.1 hypothetical protein [Anaerofilum hominis]
MKRLKTGAAVLLLAGLLGMAVNRLAVPLPDWAVRAAGIAALAGAGLLVFTVARGALGRAGGDKEK